MRRSGRGQLGKSGRKARIRVALLRRYGRHCHWCGDRMTWPETDAQPQGADMTFEHLNPRWRGGRSNKENLRLACFDCNNDRSRIDKPWWKTAKQRRPDALEGGFEVARMEG